MRYPSQKVLRLATFCLVALLLLRAGSVHAYPIKPRFQEQSGITNMKRAVDLMALGRLKEADALLQKFTEGQPNHMDAELARAQIAVTQSASGKAEAMVNAVLSRQDSLPEAHNMKGVILLLKKDNVGAQQQFMRAVQLQPKYITPRLYLAVMARMRNDFSEAAQQYKGLTEVSPHLSSGYLGQAEAQTMMHREGDAMQTLERWKAADDKSILPYQVLASIDLSDHKPQDAILELQAALVMNPNDTHLLTLLGDAYAAAGNQTQANSQYEAAMASNKANSDAALRLGTQEAAAGQTERALTHLRVVLHADPTNALACNDAAFLLADRGTDLNEALRLAETAVKSNPKYADARDTLGYVHYRRGEYGQAVSTLQQAKGLDPASRDIAAHLGLAYAKTGHKQEAMAELKRALQPGGSVSNRPELERTLAGLSKT